MHMAEGVPLPGGRMTSGLVRQGHQVRRPTGPWSPADLADAAWAFVPLAPPAQLAQAGFDPLPDLPERLRLFVDAYGLADRVPIVSALRHAPLDAAERVKYAPVDAAGAAASLEFLAGQLRWIHDISADLARAL
jgi:hypothetical protein